MSHYFESGFTVRQPAWHGLGNVLDENPTTWDDARLAAGLMWEPKAIPVYQRTTITADEWAGLPAGAVTIEVLPDGRRDCMVPVDGFQGVARDDNGKVLGVPTDSYSVIGNGEMGSILELAIEQSGRSVKFETAGSLKGGRHVYALARLDEPFTVPGDDTETFPYFAFLNSHDGGGACKVMMTTVRVVCWNTFSAADAAGERDRHQVSIRHMGNTAERVEAAKRVLAGVREAAAEWRVLATELIDTPITSHVVDMFLERFIPTPENATERLIAARDERRAIVRNLYELSPSTDGGRGTAYGLV